MKVASFAVKLRCSLALTDWEHLFAQEPIARIRSVRSVADKSHQALQNFNISESTGLRRKTLWNNAFMAFSPSRKDHGTGVALLETSLWMSGQPRTCREVAMMNRLFSNGTVAWLMMTSGFAVAQSDSESQVRVTVRSGRQFVAEIDARTSDTTLWLRYGTSNTTLLRPIQWNYVVQAEQGGEMLGKADLIEMARDAKSPSLSSEVSSPETYASASQSTGADRAGRALGLASQVRSVEVDASLGNWDSDVEADGLVVAVTPLDELGQPVEINGVLYVTLTCSQRENSSRVAHGERIGPIGNWTVALNAQQWNKPAYVVRLPFQAVDPEFNTKVAAHGMVHVRLVIPGNGWFDRTIDGVRIRTFSPLRDQLERDGKSRWMSYERTGRN